MKYLITSFTGLGNMINKTPMMKKIHELDSSAEIYVIGDNRWGGLDVIKHSSYIKYCLDLSSNKISRVKDLISWLNSIRFDAIFIPANTAPPQNILVSYYLSNVNKIVKTSEVKFSKKAGIFYQIMMLIKNFQHSDSRIINVAIEDYGTKKKHEIDANYDLFEAFWGKEFERSYQTWVDYREDLSILYEYGLQGKKYICIQIGASNGNPTTKKWPINKFILLLKQFINNDVRCVLLGDNGDKILADKIQLGNSNIINLLGKTSINELINLVKYSRGIICHDSGIMHLSGALRAPTIALIGPSNIYKIRPHAKTCQIIYLDVPCSPCLTGWTGQGWTEAESVEKCQYNNYCMRDIPIDMVFRKANKLFQLD